MRPLGPWKSALPFPRHRLCSYLEGDRIS
ncbi:MAG: hypothetical protein AB1486_16915 [Planctomycetota bacterium]